ncbi:hypothetical protein [Streptomyces fractus]|uniref:hypothetical protein n=1 Tax=Streptomyces fractus TaxID=641806 RepID=UPI003CF618AC
METTHLLVSDLAVDTALADLSLPHAVRLSWQLLYECDIRLREVVSLDVNDVELGARQIGYQDVKDGSWYPIGITESLAAQLRGLIGPHIDGPLLTVDGRRVTTDEIASLFRDATGKSVHALRFTRMVRRNRSPSRLRLVIFGGGSTNERT